MNENNIKCFLNSTRKGTDIHSLIRKLYRICRSITGEGVRSTLQIISEHVGLKITEVKSGSDVLDWTIPLEWNIHDAYIKSTINGNRIIDFNTNNLHVMSYSTPIQGRFRMEYLRSHLFSIEDQPDVIPYRTSYYKENWGFCLTHNQLENLKDEEYDICIDSTLTKGHLTYGEAYLPGKIKDEVLISTHICHPSLCNDNLSGIAISTYLSKCLQGLDRKYSYRFLFIPATIGAITWLSKNRRKTKNIKFGLVLAGLGDSGSITYKRSRSPSETDKIMEHVLKNHSENSNTIDFFPYGYDERQYCSPGFDLPVGCLMRTPYGEYKEYHTSADNLTFVKPEHLEDSLRVLLYAIMMIENNVKPKNTHPYGEPQLGNWGVKNSRDLPTLWVLNSADGKNSLLEIANKAKLPFVKIYEAYDLLRGNGLLK